jgi:response regulator RpfG family c-di-GMP phosphodiesterase
MRTGNYFHISINHLKDQKIFPFNLFLYNPLSRVYTLYLEANGPLLEEKLNFLALISRKGGIIAVSLKQKKTFLTHLEHKEEDIPSLKRTIVSEQEKQSMMFQELLRHREEKSGKFYFKDAFNSAAERDDYLQIIEQCHDEILAFSYKINSTVSMAIYLADIFLTKDTHLNRVVAASYFIAKQSGIEKIEALGELICAAFLHNVGSTVIDYNKAQKPLTELDQKDQIMRKKHGMLADYVIKRSKFNLTERCVKIIIQHHERYNGTGYPNELKGDQIDPLALIIGAVSHVFEFSSGQINGSTTPIKSVLSSIKNKNYTTGLDLEFGSQVISAMEFLLNGTDLKKAA